MSNNFEIAERLKSLRLDLEIASSEMAKVTGLSETEYLEFETGEKDFSVTMLYNAAEKFGVDVTSLLTGNTPKLSGFSVVKKGQGVLTERRSMFTYEHLAYNFKDKTAEPFRVVAPFVAGCETKPIQLSSHKGQEMDFVLSGRLKVVVGDKTVVLDEGDTIYYDSSVPHGMIAVDGEDAVFVAVVLKQSE